MIKNIIVLILAAAVVYGGYYYWKAEPEAEVEAPVAVEIVMGTQNAGETISIEKAVLEDPGYIVVTKDGEVIGASAFLEAGAHENISIVLKQPISDTDTIDATVHTDNGDGFFDEMEDLPATDGSGYMVTDSEIVGMDEGITDDAEMDADGTGVVDDAQNSSVTEGDVSLDITGKNFEFSEKEIRIKEGEQVTINLASAGGTHDWVVDEFDARTALVSAGESTSVTFVADKKGTFEYYCSVGSHRSLGMVGTLIVE